MSRTRLSQYMTAPPIRITPAAYAARGVHGQLPPGVLRGALSSMIPRDHRLRLRSCSPKVYLNHRLEQDHRGIKQRYRPTCGLKTFATAARFCRLFDEIWALFRPQSRHNQRLSLHQRRHIHRAQFTQLMGMMAAA
jgi:hypothetical protein